MRKCTVYPNPSNLKQCKESFKLLYFEAESDIANYFRPTWDVLTYTHIDTIAADETFETNNEIKINSELRRVPVTKNGLYLAFLDEGACTTLISLRVYYLKCPATTLHLAHFPETPTKETATQVTGQCVENASSMSMPYYYCQSNGKWEYDNINCNCMAGYEPSKDNLACSGEIKQ